MSAARPSSAITIPAAALWPHQRADVAAYQAGATYMYLLEHRQCGKTRTAAAILALAAWQEPGTHVYVAPTFRMAKNILWDGLMTNGEPYLSVLPAAVIRDRSENEMALTVQTQVPGKTSRILLLSGDEPDRLRGLAIRTCVIDEYAMFETGEVMRVVRPSLAASRGRLVLLTTPQGPADHAAELWHQVQDDPQWYTVKRTITDTTNDAGDPLITEAHVEQERREGAEPSWLRREYYCDFSAPRSATYYGDLMMQLEERAQITDVPVRREQKVYVALDLGIHDASAAVAAQLVGDRVNIVWAKEWVGLSLPEVIAEVQKPGWVIGRWVGPHDLGTREISSGQSRAAVAADLGVRFLVLERLTVMEGIDAVRRTLPRCWMDRRQTAPLHRALTMYGKIFDPTIRAYREAPKHDQWSHLADAMRYLCLGLEKLERRERMPLRAYTARGLTSGWAHAPWPRLRRGGL